MYITLRYAHHWAEGAGLVWNIGAPPVEGYSNFLFVVIAALCLKIGIDPIIGLKVLGILGLCLTMLGLYRLSRLWFSPWVSLLPVFWLLFYRDEMTWVSSGLETTCYQAMVVFSVYGVLQLVGAPKDLGHVEHRETSLGYGEIPHFVQDCVRLLRCVPDKGWPIQKNPPIHHRYTAWILLGILLALMSFTRPEGAIWGMFILGLSALGLWYAQYKITPFSNFLLRVARKFQTSHRVACKKKLLLQSPSSAFRAPSPRFRGEGETEGRDWEGDQIRAACAYVWDACSDMTRRKIKQHVKVNLRLFGLKLPRGWWCAVFTFMICVVPYFLWRLHYYGLLLPNPVYCKGFATSYFLSIDKDYLRFAWPLLLLGLFAQWQTKDSRLVFLWLPTVLYLLLLMNADPVSAFYQRLFLPVIPLLFPLALLGIQMLIQRWMPYDAWHPHQRASILLIVIACCFAEIVIPVSSLQSLQKFTQFPQEGEALRREVVQWLEQHVQQRDRVVLADSGLIPYSISAQFDDSYCLNNRWMAEQPFDKMFDRYCLRILSEKPQVIILSSLRQGPGNDIYYSPADVCFNRYLAQSVDYKKESTLSTANHHGRMYQYEVYALRTDKN